MRKLYQIPNQESQTESDRLLVQSIIDGSFTAWRTFLDTHAALIFRTIRRFLFTNDEDEARSVYADILKNLYDHDLSKYQGKSSLKAWLILYTRNHAFDCYRRKYGRFRLPKGYYQLSELDKRIFTLFYIERMPLEVIIHMLCWQGYNINANTVYNSIQRSIKIMDRRFMKRIERRPHTSTRGGETQRTLEYLVQLRAEYEEKLHNNRPDTILMEKEISEQAQQLRMLLSTLPREDRKVIFLRFYQGHSAKKIAAKLDLNSERKVYTIIDRIIRNLRRSLDLQKNNIKKVE